MNGYIKLHRKIKNWKFYKVDGFLLLWVHMLFEAHHGDDPIYDGFGNKICRGQFSTGRKRLSEETGLSASKVERILKSLEIEQQIEQQKTNKCRIITITNWDVHQKANSTLDNKWTTSGQQVDNKWTQNKNVKNVKNGKNGKNIHAHPENFEHLDQTKVIQKWNEMFPSKTFKGFYLGGGKHETNYLKSASIIKTLDEWVEIFNRVKNSNFLQTNSWSTLTWVINYDNAMEIMQGKYDNEKINDFDYNSLPDYE
jgi:hypothetical protein